MLITNFYYQKNMIFLVFLIFISLIPFSSTFSTPSYVENRSSLEQGFVLVSHVSPSTIIIDGTINPGEYPTHYSDPITEIDVYFSHNGTELFVGIVSPAKGWLGIGLGPDGTGMDAANIFIGYINDETLVWEDHYGVGVGHVADTDFEGGSTDLGKVEGQEDATSTIIEFSCPLSSGDEYDHHFVSGGTYGFFVANNPNRDDLKSYHPERSATITLVIEATSLLMPLQLNPQIIMDGLISQNEYEQHFHDPVTSISVFMQHNSSDMFIGLVSPSLGWVGIGFGPTGIGMNNSNIIIGFVTNSNNLSIADNYGVGTNHYADSLDGGTDEVKASAGSENTSHTTMEFIFPLSTGDGTHDHNFTLFQTYGFFLSRSIFDNFISMHPVHSPTYDVYIGGESISPLVVLSVSDENGNEIQDGSSLPQGTVLIFTASFSTANGTCECLTGILVNFHLNSTFGMRKEAEAFTDKENTVSFTYNVSSIIGRIGFVIELPPTQVAWQLLSQSQAAVSVEVTSTYHEELYFFDDPQIFGLVSVGILVAAGSVFLTYLYVLFNAGRIFQKTKS
ncbi:MAG: DOMON domain-containing protein [Candidatus Hodarchaeales archaeon]|jgi:hypothetical protein